MLPAAAAAAGLGGPAALSCCLLLAPPPRHRHLPAAGGHPDSGAAPLVLAPRPQCTSCTQAGQQAGATVCMGLVKVIV